MIYAAKILKTDNCLSFGGMDGKLLNEAFGFKNKAAFDAEQKKLWHEDRFDGEYNLIRLSRKKVVEFFTRNFAVANDGTICESIDAADRHDDTIRAKAKATAAYAASSDHPCAATRSAARDAAYEMYKTATA